MAAIGPAGENLVRFASIVTDRTYQAPRMWLGAVMGSKHLKAVVLRGGATPEVFDQPAIERLTDNFASRMKKNSLSLWQFTPPGFSCWIYLHGLDATLCVHNYRESSFPGLEAFQEEHFLERPVRELGCLGCPNGCMKAIHPKGASDLDPRASGIHQEITGSMGPNIGVGDLDLVVRMNSLCNQYGMDPASLGFTISFAYAVSPVSPRYDICEHDWDFDTQVGWSHARDLSRTLGILERVPMSYLGPDKVRNFSIWRRKSTSSSPEAAGDFGGREEKRVGGRV